MLILKILGTIDSKLCFCFIKKEMRGLLREIFKNRKKNVDALN